MVTDPDFTMKVELRKHPLRGLSLLRSVNDTGEYFWLVFGEISKDLAVQLYVGFQKTIY